MCHAHGILELHSHFIYHRLKPVAIMFSHGYAISVGYRIWVNLFPVCIN